MQHYSKKQDREVHLTVESATNQALELKIRKTCMQRIETQRQVEARILFFLH